MSGLREGHTSIIESRGRDIETDTAAKIASALGVSLDWLISGKGVGPRDAEIPPVVADLLPEAG